VEKKPESQYYAYDLSHIPTPESAEAYLEMVRKDPNDADSFFLLGALYLKNNKTVESMEMFEQSARLNPQNWMANFLLGTVYLSYEKWDIAVRYYLKSLKLVQDFTPLLFNLGLCYEKLDYRTKAINSYKNFMNIEQSQEWLHEVHFRLHKLGVDIKKA